MSFIVRGMLFRTNALLDVLYSGQRFKRALPMVKRYVELRNEHGLTSEECAYMKVYIDDYIPVC